MAVTKYLYTRAQLKASINARIHGKIGAITNPNTLCDDVVNEVSGLYLRTAKRKAPLAPNLFNDIYQYAAPTDIDGGKLIGIQPQSMNRDRNNIWSLVTEEEFDIRKQTDYNLVAFADHTYVRTLLISAFNSNLKELTIAQLQALTGDATNGTSWSSIGQATNLQTDTYNFIKGSGSIEFDIQTGGSTAGIQLSNVNTFDLTQYISAGSIFTWAYINNASNITSITLQLGTNSSNYYQMTATTPNDGTTFVNGWNLVRFDMNNKTKIGSPVTITGNFVSLFFNLSSSTVTDTGYRFNWLNAKQGNISNLIYYSASPWENATTGAYSNFSGDDSDYIVCDQDEWNLFVEKGVEIFGYAARETADAQVAALRYGDPAKKTGMSYDYKRNYPTESLMLTSTYYYMGNPGVNNNPNNLIRF